LFSLFFFTDLFCVASSHIVFRRKEELTLAIESDAASQQQQQQLHRRAFIEEIILRLVRISYLQNIAQTLPTEFQMLLPSEPQPHFPFVGHTEAEDLLSRLRQRESPEQLRVWLEQENPSSLGASTRIELFVACLLHLGSKSLSHLINMLDCYAPLLLNTPHQRFVLNLVWQYWGGYNGRGSQQHLIMTLLKFLAYRIVTPYSIIEWLLSDDFLLANTVNNNLTQSPMTKLFFWEILNRVLDKTLFTTHTLRTKLHELSVASQGPQQNIVELETVKEAYAMALKEQDSVFELTFRRLAEILQANHDIPTYNFWYHMTLGHLKSLGRRYYRHLGPLIPTLAIHFTNVDSRIREVFTQITSLVTNYS
jgi:nuclear cap-binding protein subunit 1